jgi:hypothetical protein
MEDEVLELVERHIAVDADPVEDRLRNAQDAFGDFEEVGLFEIRVCRVIDQRDRLGDLVFELRADLFIGAFGGFDEAFEELLILDIKIDLEVFGGIGLPVEF